MTDEIEIIGFILRKASSGRSFMITDEPEKRRIYNIRRTLPVMPGTRVRVHGKKKGNSLEIRTLEILLSPLKMK